MNKLESRRSLSEPHAHTRITYQPFFTIYFNNMADAFVRLIFALPLLIRSDNLIRVLVAFEKSLYAMFILD